MSLGYQRPCWQTKPKLTLNLTSPGPLPSAALDALSLERNRPPALVTSTKKNFLSLSLALWCPYSSLWGIITDDVVKPFLPNPRWTWRGLRRFRFSPLEMNTDDDFPLKSLSPRDVINHDDDNRMPILLSDYVAALGLYSANNNHRAMILLLNLQGASSLRREDGNVYQLIKPVLYQNLPCLFVLPSCSTFNHLVTLNSIFFRQTLTRAVISSVTNSQSYRVNQLVIAMLDCS